MDLDNSPLGVLYQELVIESMSWKTKIGKLIFSLLIIIIGILPVRGDGRIS